METQEFVPPSTREVKKMIRREYRHAVPGYLCQFVEDNPVPAFIFLILYLAACPSITFYTTKRIDLSVLALGTAALAYIFLFVQCTKNKNLTPSP